MIEINLIYVYSGFASDVQVVFFFLNANTAYRAEKQIINYQIFQLIIIVTNY